jgi:hypothetical protein
MGLGQTDMEGLGQTDMEVLDVQKLNMFVCSQIAKTYKYKGDTLHYKLLRSERRNVEVESALFDYYFIAQYALTSIEIPFY